MAKKLLQDMKTSTRRPAPSPVRPARVEKREEVPPRAPPLYFKRSEATRVEYPIVAQRGGSRYGLWVVALASAVFLFFSFSLVFSGAKITVNPRVEEMALNQNFSAMKDGAADDLPFELMVLSGEEDKNIEGGQEVDVALRAEGLVVIYNNFSSSSQPLAIDTRLEGSNGKIYKTTKATVVPGTAGSTPGAVEVRVYGAEAGADYNSSPLDFKILGFKGTSKYDKFYGRSKDDIKGGFVGKQRQVSETDKVKVLNEIRGNLKAKLSSQATGQIPAGFILFKDAVFLNADEESFTGAPGSSIVEVRVRGTLYGILFDEKALTKEIIGKVFPGEEENEVYIQNIRNLTFSVPGASAYNTKSSFENIQNVNFNLSGISNAIWKVDEDKLLGDVAGKAKKDFNQILLQYPNILSADLSLRPFWKSSLPDKKEDISVVVSYPE